MARSKEQTTEPFPRRLTRAQRAAACRNNIDEPPSDEGTTAVVAAVEPPPVDATAAATAVEEASIRVETNTIVQPESPGPMAGRHLSHSQIIAPRRHSVAAAVASPKTTGDGPTPVTSERNPPLNPPQPPPTVTTGTSTTTLASHPPPKTTLRHPYTMEVVDNAHIVLTHHHSTTLAGTSTIRHIPTTPSTQTLDPLNTNPKPKPGDFRDFDLNEIGQEEVPENVLPLADKKGKKPMVISTPRRVTRSSATVVSGHRSEMGDPSTGLADSACDSSSNSTADDSVSDEPYEDLGVLDEPPPKRTRASRRQTAEQVPQPFPTFQQRYDALLDKKLHMERGFSIALVEGYNFIKSHLESHGWLDLVNHPYRVNVTLVREFYAALEDTGG